MNLTFAKATANDTEKIFNLVQKTIRAVYPKYYPPKVVDFFCEHHNMENILADIQNGFVYSLISSEQILGTVTTIEKKLHKL